MSDIEYESIVRMLKKRTAQISIKDLLKLLKIRARVHGQPCDFVDRQFYPDEKFRELIIGVLGNYMTMHQVQSAFPKINERSLIVAKTSKQRNLNYLQKNAKNEALMYLRTVLIHKMIDMGIEPDLIEQTGDGEEDDIDREMYLDQIAELFTFDEIKAQFRPLDDDDDPELRWMHDAVSDFLKKSEESREEKKKKKDDQRKVESALKWRSEGVEVHFLHELLLRKVKDAGEQPGIIFEELDEEDRDIIVSLLSGYMSIEDVVKTFPLKKERVLRDKRKRMKRVMSYLENNAGDIDVDDLRKIANRRLLHLNREEIPPAYDQKPLLARKDYYKRLADIYYDASDMHEYLEKHRNGDSKSEEKDEPAISLGDFLDQEGLRKQTYDYLTNPDQYSSVNPKNPVPERVKYILTRKIEAVELLDLEKLDAVQKKLSVKYPHATNVIEGILGGIRRGFRFGRRMVAIRPTLLVGAPGTGKSALAEDLMRALDIATTRVSVGGMTGTNLFGVHAGYSTSLPSIVTTSVANARVINPGLIIDEVDKTPKRSVNGDVIDTLLALLEPNEAKTWYEPFLASNVDASHVNWFMTANQIDMVDTPLISRCDVYRVEQPDAKHVGNLVKSIVAEYASEVGVDPRFFQLSSGDIQYLEQTMPKHKSVRVLKQLVRVILDEHEQNSFDA
ncbi:hypothetical protein XM53_00895 [Roseovarius atlanticus]|uniref:AAA+ ATPase domain-containing protein n=1 Tax=Roseovarius atlanticus TaxID=1641875 RepID=A0A0T5NZM8_9RHOB|nr:AAA family ATPase [Roseovarius atlanticus]KRS14322.1 hypothetical protein XM53_00895 [Roseovarius atlanticus]